MVHGREKPDFKGPSGDLLAEGSDTEVIIETASLRQVGVEGEKGLAQFIGLTQFVEFT